MEKKKRGRKPKATLTGFGDVVELMVQPVVEVYDAVIVREEKKEDCTGCDKRRKKLNRLWSFYKKPTDDDISFLRSIFEWYKGLPISPERVNDIIKCEDIWMRLANVKTEPCRTCGAAYQNNYMDKLREIYENYV